MKEQLSQLVQDVIDGEESPAKAKVILDDLYAYIKKCRHEVSKYVVEKKNKKLHYHWQECDATESDLH